MTRWLIGVGLAVLASACGNAKVQPAALEAAPCAHCWMTVSDPTLAAQIAAPGEEPRFFDDIGCLSAYLKAHPSLSEGAVAFVADHRTREWVPASAAVFTRVPAIETPMSSNLVAHASSASRDQDRDVADGQPVSVAEVLGPMTTKRGGL